MRCGALENDVSGVGVAGGIAVKSILKSVMIVSALLTLCGAAQAQYYQDFDSISYARSPNALRVYFDETVSVNTGPIPDWIEYYTESVTATPQAYLVLINPSASTLAGWQCRFSIVGQGTAGAPMLLGPGAVNTGTGDDFIVSYPVPRPMPEIHVPLLQYQLALGAGTIPGHLRFGYMEFYIKPLASGTPASPGYRDGVGNFIATPSLTSPFHGWEVPCMMLNNVIGVVGAAPSTWGGVKALYR